MDNSLRLENLKARAKSESVPTAMSALINLCSMVFADPGLLSDEVLAVLYHHLQSDPTSLPEKDKIHGLEPETVLAAISLNFMTQFIIGPFRGTDVVSSIQDQWPVIWRWASYIVEQGIEKERDEEVEGEIMSRGHLQGVMGDLFSALTAQSRLCGILGSSPDVISTMTRLYFRAVQRDHHSRIPLHQAIQRLVVISNLSLETTALQTFMQQPVNTFNVRPSDLAQVMLNLVNNDLDQPKIPCVVLVGSLINISGCTRESAAFSQGFISRGSVSSVARVFSRLTSYKQSYADRNPMNYRMAVACLKFGGQYLQECFKSGGFSCIIEAVEGHLLTSILKAHHFVAYELEYPIPLPPTSLEAILIDLLKTVGSYSVYHSVLRATEKSLGRIDEHSTEQCLVKQSRLHTSWKTFRGMVEPRLWNLGYYDDDGINICNSGSCPTSSTSTTMRRCGGCGIAFYCSKECQKSDWKSHKGVCNRLVRDRDLGSTREMDARDCSFLEELLECNITAYVDSDDEDIDTKKRNHIANNPAHEEETLIPKFDFRCMPMEQTFITLEQLIDIDEDLQEDIDELLADEIAGKRLFYMIVPHHGTPLRRVFRV